MGLSGTVTATVGDEIDKSLAQRLLDYGNEVYGGCASTQRVLMWVFTFYDASADCPACRDGLERMYGWFHRYGFTTDRVRGVRMVVEDEPGKNRIYGDLGMQRLPAHIFTDSEGRIFDVLFTFPDDAWLESHILPIFQKDTAGLL